MRKTRSTSGLVPAQAIALGLQIVYPLTDQPWGRRPLHRLPLIVVLPALCFPGAHASRNENAGHVHCRYRALALEHDPRLDWQG